MKMSLNKISISNLFLAILILNLFEDNARLVRDVYAFFPMLMKYTDLHRAKWLKTPSWESDGIYENVAVIFRIWLLLTFIILMGCL